MRLILLAAVAAVGCASNAPSDATFSTLPESRPSQIHRFHVNANYIYVVDTATESCFLEHWNGVNSDMEAVDCAKLARNVAETARVITWVGAPAAPPATP